MIIDPARMRDRIAEENELRRSWHEPDLAHALDVVARAGIDGEAGDPGLDRGAGGGGAVSRSRAGASPARPRRRSTTSPPSTP